MPDSARESRGLWLLIGSIIGATATLVAQQLPQPGSQVDVLINSESVFGLIGFGYLLLLTIIVLLAPAYMPRGSY